MAITFRNPLKSRMFLSELECLVFTDSEHSNEPCTFSITSGVELFSNTYTPSSDGWVKIYDIDKIIESLMSTYFRYYIFTINGEVFPVQVFASSVDLDMDGDEFLDNYFLTPLMAPRATTPGRHEVLYAACQGLTYVYARANYYKDGAITGRTYTLGSINGVAYVDVSCSQFVNDELGVLVGYTVACGDRRAEYRVWPTMPPADPCLIYLNCFGVWETIFLTGAKETSGEYTRHAALIDGKMRNYAIDEVIKHQAYTGPLLDGADALAYDLARSKSVFLLEENGVAGDEVVILDCKTAKSNDPSAIPDFTFEYRRANRRTDKLSSQRPPRIFDDTFDDTFN